MLPYFFLLSIPAMMSFSFRKRAGLFSLISVFIIYVLFMGLRYEVGPDWTGYEHIHFVFADKDFLYFFSHSEPLSYLLFWFSENSGYHMLVSNIIASAILMFGVITFARRSINPWVSIVSATPYLIIAFGMSGLRQAMAVGVFLFILSIWEKTNTIQRTIGILLATMFHTSALITGLFVLYDMKLRTSFKIFFGIFFSGISFYLILNSANEDISKYQSTYIEDAGKVVSSGSLLHIAMIAIPAFLAVIFKKRIKRNIHNKQLLLLGIFATLIVIATNSISTTVASRLTLYLYFIPMMVYPAIVKAFGNKLISAMLPLVILFHFAILTLWLLFATNSFAHIPYQTVLS